METVPAISPMSRTKANCLYSSTINSKAMALIFFSASFRKYSLSLKLICSAETDKY